MVLSIHLYGMTEESVWVPHTAITLPLLAGCGHLVSPSRNRLWLAPMTVVAALRFTPPFAVLIFEFGTPLFQVYCVMSASRPLLSV
jgi:hypothetical protein